MSRARQSKRAARVEATRPALLAAFLAALCTASHAHADDAPAVRRVYIPADRVSELGAQFPELRTLSRQDLDALLRRAESLDSPALPLVESARYEARLDGDTLSGAAELTIRGRIDERGLLRWPASAWRITQAKWSAESAIVGYAGAAQLGLLVPAGDSHRLTFEWAAPPRSSEEGPQFNIELPPSLRSELVLDLPPGLTPRVSGAHMTGPTDTPRPELKRWSVRWAPAAALRLLLAQDGGPRRPAAQLFYEREMEVDVAEEGAELVARFGLTVAHDSVRRIEIEHSPDLSVYSWSGVKVHDWESRGDVLVLELAEPLTGSAQLTLRAVAAGPSSESWTLPRLEIAGGRWTGGSTRVRPASGLNFCDVQVARGRIAARQGSDSARPEFVIEHSAPNAGFSASVSSAQPQVFARVNSTLRFTPQPEAVALVRWQGGAGESSILRLHVPTHWSVSAAEASPGVLARWTVENGGERGVVLNLRLNRPLAADAIVQIQVFLRGPEWDAAVTDAAIRLPRIVPLDVHVPDETIAVEQNPAWAFELDEAEGVTLVPRSFGGASAANPGVAATYRFDGPEAAGRLAVHRLAPKVTAEISANVEIDEQTIRAKYELDLEFPAGPPERLDVRFSAAARESLAWSLSPGVRVEPEFDDAVAGDTKIWRVVLPRSPPRRMRLAATWRTPIASPNEIPLPTIVQSSSTTGDVSITVPLDLTVTPNTDGLAPMPVSRGAGGSGASGLKPAARELAWKYDRPAPRLRLEIAPNPQAVPTASWVARTEIKTELDATGDAIHAVRYDIHSHAGTEFTVALPPGAVLRRAHSSDGAIVASEPGVLRAASVSAGAPWRVDVEYSQTGRGLTRWAKCEFPLPRVSLPSLCSSWEFHVPPGYRPAVWCSELVAGPPHARKTPLARLFGPLVRRTDDEPFAFWAAAAWRSWWGRQSGARPDPIEARLEDSLREFVRDVRPRERSWARLLNQLDQSLGRPLVADVAALDASGVDLNSPVRLPDDSAQGIVAALAANPEVSLLRTPRGLLVTSREQAVVIGEAQPGARLRRLADSGGLSAAVDEALLNDVDASGRFALLGHWLASPKDPTGGRARPAAVAPGEDRTWRFESATDLPAISVTLIASPLVGQATAVALALAVVLACLMRPRAARLRASIFGFSSGIGFALALALPEAISAPAVVFAWSQLAIAIFSTRRRRAAAVARPQAAPVQRPSTLSHVATGAIIALVLWPVRPSSGQTDSTRKPPPDAIVFIPYDPDHPEKRHEITRVLVPHSLHERLIQSRNATAEIDQPVLIRSAQYSAALDDDVATLTIEFELENLAPLDPARCPLPLAGFLLREARLDGEPCLLRSAPDGFSVEVRGPGVHRLRLEGALAVETGVGQRAIDLPIPPVPSAKFAATLKPGAKIELDAAVGSPEFHESPEGGRFIANLGATARLRARWGADPASRRAGVVRADVASLWSWLDGPPQLHARVYAAAEGGSLARIVLELDAWLILKRIQAPNLAGYWIRPATEPPQLVLEFERPAARSVTVELEFVMPDAMAGTIALPEVRVAEAQPRAVLLAIRTDDGHRLRLGDPQDAQPASADEFQSAWGESLPATDGAAFVRRVGRAVPLSIEKTLAPAATRLRTQADVRAGRGRLETMNHISLVTAVGRSFRQELTLPPGMKLASVRPSSGTEWRAITADRLLWFGAIGESAVPTIDVDGWLPLARTDVSLPIVRPAGDAELTGELLLWRTPDTTLAVREPRGLTPTRLRGDARPPAGDFVAEAAFTVESADCSATIVVDRQAPKVAASVATRLVMDDAGAEWVSVVEYQIMGGSVESLELRLPAGFGPLEIEGDGIRQRSVHTDGPDQVWRIHLLEPRSANYRILLRARQDATSGGAAAPCVRPQGVAESRHYLLIQNATERELQVLGIDGQRGVAADTFARWFSEPVTSNVVAAAELSDPRVAIEVRADNTPEPPAGPTSILERHQAWIRRDGATLVASDILYQPRSAGDAVLRLPHSAVVFELRLDGSAVQPVTDGNGDQVVHLESGYRPHEVTVLWRWPATKATSGARIESIQLPRLSDAGSPSVWTVHVPAQSNGILLTPQATCRSFAAAAQAQVLGDEIHRMLPLSKGDDATERSEVLWDVERSFLATVYAAERALEIEAEVRLPSRELRAAHERAAAQLARLLDENRQLFDRFGLGSLLARSVAQAPRFASNNGSIFLPSSDDVSRDDLTARFSADFEVPPNGATMYAVASDSDLSISYRASDAVGRVPVVPSVLAGLAGAMLCVFVAGPRRRGWLAPLGLVAAGAFWCWTLQPQPLGVAFFVAALVAVFARIVRRRVANSASPAAVS